MANMDATITARVVMETGKERMSFERAIELFKISSPWLRRKVKEGADCRCSNCLLCSYLTLNEALIAKVEGFLEG